MFVFFRTVVRNVLLYIELKSKGWAGQMEADKCHAYFQRRKWLHKSKAQCFMYGLYTQSMTHIYICVYVFTYIFTYIQIYVYIHVLHHGTLYQSINIYIYVNVNRPYMEHMQHIGAVDGQARHLDSLSSMQISECQSHSFTSQLKNISRQESPNSVGE